MRPMRLIHKNLHILLMRKFYNCLKIRTNSIICRIIYKYCHCIRIFPNRLLYL